MRAASRVLFVALLLVSGVARAGDEASAFHSPGVRLGGTLDELSSLRIEPSDRSSLVREADLEAFPRIPFDSREAGRRPRAGDGGGADIAFGSFQVLQTSFIGSDCPRDCDAQTPDVQPCNVVLLLWTEEIFNPDGVAVLADGNLITTVQGVPEADLPDTNGIFLTNAPAGVHTFRVEDPNGGSSDELDLLVLDRQPFRDVTNVEIAQGIVGGDGTCQIVVCWSNRGPMPTSNSVLVNDGFVGSLPNETFSLRTAASLSGAPPGDYLFEVVGFLDDPANPRLSYRGCFVASEQETIDCQPEACAAPFHPQFVQLSYDDDAGANGNILLAFWFNGDTYPNGITLLDGDTSLGPPLDGASEAALVNLPPGNRDVGIQGACSAGTMSEATRDEVNVLPENPWSGTLTDDPPLCEFDPDVETTTITWTASQESDFIAIWRSEDPADPVGGFAGPNLVAFLPGVFAGTPGSFTAEGTTEDTVLSLQFFRYEGDEAYGSEPVTCEEPEVPEFFVRGLCTGSPNTSNPQITDAIVLLSFLFAGAETPPCRQACDTNGSDSLELTDAVFLLTFLFLGGDQPPGWMDRIPTCSPVDETSPLDCVTPLARCVGEGPAPAP